MKNNEVMRITVTHKGVMIEADGNSDGADIMSALIRVNLAIVTQYCKPEGKINVFNVVSEIVKKELNDNNYLEGVHSLHSSSEEESEKIREDFAKGGVFSDGKLH